MTLTAPSTHDMYVAHCFANACSVALTLLRLTFSPCLPLSFPRSLPFGLCPHFVCRSGFGPKSVLPPKVVRTAVPVRSLELRQPAPGHSGQPCGRGLRGALTLPPRPARNSSICPWGLGAETLPQSSSHLQDTLGFGEHPFQPWSKFLSGHGKRDLSWTTASGHRCGHSLSRPGQGHCRDGVGHDTGGSSPRNMRLPRWRATRSKSTWPGPGCGWRGQDEHISGTAGR